MRIAVAGGTGVVGQHVVGAAVRHRHEAVTLSRSTGADVSTGEGLAEALDGIDVIIDVANAGTIDQGEATRFFTDVAANLQRVGDKAGVRRIITLSIVGIEKTTFGYYRAKLEHERAAASGPVPSTIQRATQFHEFAAQLVGMTRHGSTARVFDVEVQPVAARSVGEVLVELAETATTDRAPDLAGPQEANLVDLARVFAVHQGAQLEIQPDTSVREAIPPRALLPGAYARIEYPTFEQWLQTPDAAAVAV